MIGRDGNYGFGPRVWPVEDCRGTVLGRGFLGRKFAGLAGWVFAGLSYLRDGPKWVMRDYMDPHFFLHF